jgi:NAD(P)-dependent dehydrogenase (short-subunit alcohol dehydrogenase family)
MQIYQNKVAVVTGAGSGIGRQLALQLARAGARVAASDVNAAGLAETLRLMPPNAQARSYRVDVSSRDAVFAHADDVRRDFGTAHFIFNNAGVSLSGTIAHSTIEEIEWQVGINLWGVIYGTKAFLPMLLAQREGHIVNVSSIFGIVAYPCKGAYNVSKFGVRGWTECLWQELEGSGVHAVSVHPGGIRTEIAQGARMSVNADETERRAMASSEKMLTTPPEDMARAILQGVARGRRRIVYGNKAGFLTLLQRWLPSSYGAALRLIQRLA